MAFNLGRIAIGQKAKPFIIAEMSGNHNQSLVRALQIVDAAAASGAHAIKIQTYTADTMTISSDQVGFTVEDSESPWNGAKLFDLYRGAHTPWEWHAEIFERAKQHGMIAFSTPFDVSAVDFLETLNVPLYKIASFENTDLNLIRRVAATGKPVIISTGMASVAELSDAVGAARDGGCLDLVLLKCTSTYPASPVDTNILTIPHLRDLFECEIGLSDHTMGVGVAVAAVALGASVIEKHFTLDRSEGGVDSTFSLEPSEMKSLVIESERAWQSLGKITYGTASPQEKKSLGYRRSLYFVRDMKAGELIGDDSVKAIRPGFGLPPKFLAMLLGKRVNQNIKRGTPAAWSLIG